MNSTIKPRKPRAKKCKAPSCGIKFQPERQMQETCCIKCALELTKIKREKKEANSKLQEKKRVKKEALEARKASKEYRDNDTSHQIKLTQNVFNKWVREVRDDKEPCISCGVQDLTGGHGGAWDCGHFLSRGAKPELKFEPLNAHKQCKSCNGGSGKYGKFHDKSDTIAKEYEKRLIVKIGQDKVDWLKGPHNPKKYTCEQLKEIRAYYYKLIREGVKDDSDRPHK